MAETIKILAQADVGAALADLYTVPAATSAVVSSVVIANRSGSTRTFSLKAAPGGVADTTAHNLYASVPIKSSNTFVATVGMTLAATDKLRVVADAAGALSVTVFGTEYT
jgi:hypothetical protein